MTSKKRERVKNHDNCVRCKKRTPKWIMLCEKCTKAFSARFAKLILNDIKKKRKRHE